MDLDKDRNVKTFSDYIEGLKFEPYKKEDFLNVFYPESHSNILDTFHQKIKKDKNNHLIAVCCRYLGRDLEENDLKNFKLRTSAENHSVQFLIYKNNIIGKYTTETSPVIQEDRSFKIETVTKFTFI